MKRVLIVGGGASGLMAAVHAAEGGASVTILEKQKKPGTKILRTGNGRCNFTNTGNASGRYHGTNPEFAEKVLSIWTPEDTVSFFTKIGIFPYRNGDWIYPHSEQARSVLNALLDQCKKRNIRIKNQEQVVSVRKRNGVFQVWTRQWHYEADSVILCCGTEASQKKEFQTGALKIVPEIKFRPYHPSLCPLLSSKKEGLRWAGVRAHAHASLLSGGNVLHEETGQIQFTQEGISGIPVMNMASDAWDCLQNREKTEVELDLVPELSEQELGDYLFFHGGKMEGLVPEKLASIISDLEKDANGRALLLKHFRITVTGHGSTEQSQVLGGGFLTSQFDPDTLMYRKQPGLFAAGEVLDIDGECGGWNLQFAWASGAIAGRSAACL